MTKSISSFGSYLLLFCAFFFIAYFFLRILLFFLPGFEIDRRVRLYLWGSFVTCMVTLCGLLLIMAKPELTELIMTMLVYGGFYFTVGGVFLFIMRSFIRFY